MKPRFITVVFLCCGLLLVSSLFGAVPPIPDQPANYVVDLAGIIDPQTEADLNRRLKELENKTTAQVVVLTINSLEGEPMERFSLRTAEKWALGQKGKDNGVLITIAVQDRKYRIEVGYGLEAILPDSLVGSIGRESFVANFRKGKYSEGISEAVRKITQRIIMYKDGRKTFEPGFRDRWEEYSLVSRLFDWSMVVPSLVILLVGGWLGVTWWWRGPEPDAGPQPDYLTSPPSDLPPAMVFLVLKSWLKKGAGPQLITATLIDLAQKGFLEIEFEETPFIVGHYRRKDLLIRKVEGQPNYEFEDLVIGTLAERKLSEQQIHVANLLPQLKNSLERESVALGLFVEEPTKAINRVRIPGLFILGAALVLAFLLMLGIAAEPEGFDWIDTLPLLMLGIGGALAAFLVAPQMPKRTWQGVLEAALWDAIGNHLKEVTQQRDLARDYSGIWDSYLPYAILFSLEASWISSFVEMRVPAPSWFQAPAVSKGSA
ncbi:MAG: TPM domain-containing protein, partial [Syntrophobacterales bacterium]